MRRRGSAQRRTERGKATAGDPEGDRRATPARQSSPGRKSPRSVSPSLLPPRLRGWTAARHPAPAPAPAGPARPPASPAARAPARPPGASDRLEQRALSQACSRFGAAATPRDGPDGRHRTVPSPSSPLSLRASSPPAPRGSSLSQRAARAPSGRLRLLAPRRRPGRAETQLLRKDGYSVKIHPFPASSGRT